MPQKNYLSGLQGTPAGNLLSGALKDIGNAFAAPQPSVDDILGLEKVLGIYTPYDETAIGRLQSLSKTLPRDDPQITQAFVDAMSGFAVPGSNAHAGAALTDQKIAEGMAALRKTMATKSDVLGAMTHYDIGPIDFRYGQPNAAGDYKGGLQHVLDEHGPEALNAIPEIIARGRAITPYERRGANRIAIDYGDQTVALSPDYFGDPGHWVVTSYAKTKK